MLAELATLELGLNRCLEVSGAEILVAVEQVAVFALQSIQRFGNRGRQGEHPLQLVDVHLEPLDLSLSGTPPQRRGTR